MNCGHVPFENGPSNSFYSHKNVYKTCNDSNDKLLLYWFEHSNVSLFVYAEGYNLKFNKERNTTHPSPGVILCHFRSQLILAQTQYSALVVISLFTAKHLA